MKTIAGRLILLLLLAVALVPLASSAPDGLEKVLGQLGWMPSGGSGYRGLFPGYAMPGSHPTGFGSILAGVVGVALVVALTTVLGTLLKRRTSEPRESKGREGT